MGPIQRVAVIGAGLAGRAFALRCVRAGFEVALEDVMPEKLRRAQDEYGALTEGSTGSLRYALNVEDAVRDADLAIDFVPDELESKLEIFSLLDRMAPPRTVLCTPTDALSITDLASCTYRAERCVGVRGGLSGGDVELVRSRYVEDDILRTVVSFWTALGQASVSDDVAEPSLVKNLAAPLPPPSFVA